MGRNIFYVAVGGMVGSVCRYISVYAVVSFLPFRFPFGTFFVNLIGSLLMGVVVGVSGRYSWFDAEWRVFLTAGFCGGFTTFSAFAFENVELLVTKNYLIFSVYSITSFAFCIAAAFIGFYMAKQ